MSNNSRPGSPVSLSNNSVFINNNVDDLSKEMNEILELNDKLKRELLIVENRYVELNKINNIRISPNVMPISRHSPQQLMCINDTPIEFINKSNIDNNKKEMKSSMNGNSNNLSCKIKKEIKELEDGENISIYNNQHNMDDLVQNGWDESALHTLNNWYKSFKEQSYCYQYILDKNRRISTKLSLISIGSSAVLSIFAGFKLWNTSDQQYQSGSDVAMMISNFIVAAISTASKRYIDDQRNEKIRTHVENIDAFLGKIYSQVYLDAKYRMNAEDFIKNNVEEYTNLMITSPNLSIDELKNAKKSYRFYNNIENMIKEKEQKILEKKNKKNKYTHTHIDTDKNQDFNESSL